MNGNLRIQSALICYLKDCYNIQTLLDGEHGILGFLHRLGLRYWIKECFYERTLFSAESYTEHIKQEIVDTRLKLNKLDMTGGK